MARKSARVPSLSKRTRFSTFCGCTCPVENPFKEKNLLKNWIKQAKAFNPAVYVVDGCYGFNQPARCLCMSKFRELALVVLS